MAHTFEEARQIALELPEDQRILLLDSLMESLDQKETNTVEAAWDSEIKRRLDEIDTGAVELVPLEDILARMDARILAKQRG